MDEDGKADYVKGANITGFIRVADAMLTEGHVYFMFFLLI